MTLAEDTADLISTSIWGETVTIVRNTITYDEAGMASDSWATIDSIQGDFQPISGMNPTVGIGQERASSHRIFLPNGTAVKQGDRIRPSGWSAGEDEYSVDSVLSDEGHVECRLSLVVGRA